MTYRGPHVLVVFTLELSKAACNQRGVSEVLSFLQHSLFAS